MKNIFVLLLVILAMPLYAAQENIYLNENRNVIDLSYLDDIVAEQKPIIQSQEMLFYSLDHNNVQDYNVVDQNASTITVVGGIDWQSGYGSTRNNLYLWTLEQDGNFRHFVQFLNYPDATYVLRQVNESDSFVPRMNDITTSLTLIVDGDLVQISNFEGRYLRLGKMVFRELDAVEMDERTYSYHVYLGAEKIGYTEKIYNIFEAGPNEMIYYEIYPKNVNIDTVNGNVDNVFKYDSGRKLIYLRNAKLTVRWLTRVPPHDINNTLPPLYDSIP